MTIIMTKKFSKHIKKQTGGKKTMKCKYVRDEYGDKELTIAERTKILKKCKGGKKKMKNSNNVKGYMRKTKSGKRVRVKGHRRKNPSKKRK